MNSSIENTSIAVHLFFLPLLKKANSKLSELQP